MLLYRKHRTISSAPASEPVKRACQPQLATEQCDTTLAVPVKTPIIRSNEQSNKEARRASTRRSIGVDTLGNAPSSVKLHSPRWPFREHDLRAMIAMRAFRYTIL